MKTIITGHIEIRGVNPYVLVSTEAATALAPGWRKPLPVAGVITSHADTPFRINLMPAGNGNFFMYLDGRVRHASRTAVGDLVTIELTFDEDYAKNEQRPLPAELACYLEATPAAERYWLRLTPSQRKEITRTFERLKSAEAASRHLKLLQRVLAGEPMHYLGRDWNSRT